MRCLHCRAENGMTIRGLCQTCAPDLHGAHDAQMKVVRDMDVAYTRATGKTSLEDWCGFEQFVESPALPVELKRAFIEAFPLEPNTQDAASVSPPH